MEWAHRRAAVPYAEPSARSMLVRGRERCRVPVHASGDVSQGQGPRPCPVYRFVRGRVDSDCGDVDGAAVDEVALVVPGGHRAGAAEFVHGTLDNVALAVGLAVEDRRTATAAAGSAAGLLVGLERNDRPDPAVT